VLALQYYVLHIRSYIIRDLIIQNDFYFTWRWEDFWNQYKTCSKR